MNEIQKKFSNFIEHNSLKGSLLLNEKLSKHSTFKIGGIAHIYFEPTNSEELIKALLFCRSEKIPFHVAGGSSNVVYSDEPFEGMIIATTKMNRIYTTKMDKQNILVHCDCGISMNAFVQFCTKNELSGAEQFAGLPGTTGGALFMNARCFEKSISEIFHSASYLNTDDFSIYEIEKNSSEWDYKLSPFQNTQRIILSATFKLSDASGNKEKIEENCKSFVDERISKGHFKYPSAGSVFKNNKEFGAPSGKLIDECGLKGTSIGGAQIAPFHGNFIININNATSKDVKALVDLAVNTVREKKGFSLVPEIIFL